MKLFVLQRYTNFLGVKLENLSFSAHVDYIKKNIGKVRLLDKVAPVSDQNTSLYLYISFIVPLFDHVDYVCGGLSEKDSETLEISEHCTEKHLEST